jgi:hypothetical protein
MKMSLSLWSVYRPIYCVFYLSPSREKGGGGLRGEHGTYMIMKA